jgi:hypothetical protein
MSLRSESEGSRRAGKVTTKPRAHRSRFSLESLEGRIAPAVFNVNSLADILNPPPGVVTLRSAIQMADNTPGGNTINLTKGGTYKITIPGANTGTNASGAFTILPGGGNLKIVNTSGRDVTIDGNHLDRVFDINPAADPATPKFTVTLQGFTVTNGVASPGDGAAGSGGGIRDQGNASLTLNRVNVIGNIATADGGGISMENAASTPWTLTINGGMISNNRAGDAGGGVETDGSGKVFINPGTVISGNTSVNQGAGIWLDAIQVGNVFQGANLTVAGALITKNKALTANNFGGGIGNAGNGAVTIVSSTVSDNFSGGKGGGFADENNQGTLTIAYSKFENNTSLADGGGIAEGGPLTVIFNTEVDGNSAGGNGGGLLANGTTLVLLNDTVANNTSGGNGGGIEVATTGTNSTINHVAIFGNAAVNNAGTFGGGIDAGANFTGQLTLVNDTIMANFASTGGGVFWAKAAGSLLTLQGTVVTQNVAASGPDFASN